MFVMRIAFFTIFMTNFTMKVAAIAISLPVAPIIVHYLSMVHEVALYSSLFVSACPFLLLVGAKLNAIA